MHMNHMNVFPIVDTWMFGSFARLHYLILLFTPLNEGISIFLWNKDLVKGIITYLNRFHSFTSLCVNQS
jgi:hypothetical protein